MAHLFGKIDQLITSNSNVVCWGRSAGVCPRQLRPSVLSAGLRGVTHGLRKRQQQAPPPAASAGGGSIGGNTGSFGKGGGGGGGGDGGEGFNSDDGAPQKTGIWKGWADRVAYDPEFPFKVLLEQVIGVGASVLGDMSSRPNWGLNELDFVFATLVVGSIVNFSLMYLLAPTAASAGASGIAGILSGEPLRSLGAPVANMFQPGTFSVGGRLLNFAYKGVVFASIGLMAGLIGTSMSNGLLILRKKLDPNFTTQNEAPNVLYNAATWGAHMGVSSNLRYQVLGGTDQILVKLMPQVAFRIYQGVIRGMNNVVGGISFVVLAKMFGVQKAAGSSATPPAEDAALEVAVAAKKLKK